MCTVLKVENINRAGIRRSPRHSVTFFKLVNRKAMIVTNVPEALEVTSNVDFEFVFVF